MYSKCWHVSAVNELLSNKLILQVHLVPEDKEGALINTLKRQYYAKRYPDLSDEELVAALFATRPEEGACLYLVS